MESQKRKYQKQKTEGKITVKHFLNTRLKGKSQEDGQTVYPLYVRVMVKAQQSDIKSRLAVLVAPDNFEWFKKEKSTLLDREINDLTDIIKSLKPFDQHEFVLQQAITIYSQSIKPLTSIIDESLKAEIRECIVKITSDSDTNSKGELMVLAQENDLIQLINWQQPAHTILDRIKTVLPDSELSKALMELESTYHQAFNFDGIYNTLNAIHRYIVPPTLADWRDGTIQADMNAYFKNSDGVVNNINQLINNHF